MKLTESKIRSFKPKEKRYSKADSNGLSINIMPTGKKSWVLEYTIEGKRKRVKLGEYPAVSLKKARELAYEKRNQTTFESNITVKELIKEWFDIYSVRWKNEKYKKTVQYRLDYITQEFQSCKASDVTRKMITNAVMAMVAKGTYETAKRSLRLLSQVFDYAIANEYTQNNPCVLVAKVIPSSKVKNMPALLYDEMPKFWVDVMNTPADTKLIYALMLANFFGTRPSELCKVKWSEFDLGNKQWVIPAHRMKMKLEHLIPIADPPLKILQDLYNERIDDGYVFKHRLDPNKPVRIESLLAVIKRAGYGGRMTTHGFRSLFSTSANNSGLWRADVIERQLAHVKTDVRHAYNRAEYIDERINLMKWWAKIVENWLENAAQQSI